MSTEDELHVQIAAAQRALAEEEAKTSRLVDEVEASKRRQNLRRELENVQKQIEHRQLINSSYLAEKGLHDRDLIGNCPDHVNSMRQEKPVPSRHTLEVVGEAISCGDAVVKGEFLWKIEGLSWLLNKLKQRGEDYLESDEVFFLGVTGFYFRYHPQGGVIGDYSAGIPQRGSVAILTTNDEDGVTFRYNIFIKQNGGEFVRWGEKRNECHPFDDVTNLAFGPDIQLVGNEHEQPIGIFGLNHQELLRSQWVENDVLTIKFEIEVLEGSSLKLSALEPPVKVPPASITTDFMSLLETGKHSDVTFTVEGESIKAHSLILCARSEVFATLLHAGMSETVSKQIEIQDCDAVTFKALLHFLYTDDFNSMHEMMKTTGKSSVCSGKSGNLHTTDTCSPQISFLQNILAVSHKYQLSRLRLWSEQQLCHHVSVSDVCSILCHANLYEAKQLEETCLKFIQKNLATVTLTPAYGSLSKELMFKISIFIAGISDSSAALAIEAQRQSGKRKRED